jgi:outer membrane receptor protein involved in Fe transport
MRKLFTLAAIIATSFGLLSSALAQDAGKGKGKIYGAVVDSESNQPVEFASVALVDPTTGRPIDGAVCDMEGKFEITKVAAGKYTISVTFIGYETKEIGNIVLEDKKDEVNLGLVKLVGAPKILNEVVIEGQRQLIEERVDRTIYNAEIDETTRGGDATDVLQRVPMLSVDLDGNVSLRGSQNIMVLINNKPSTIMAANIADALKQIPADQIKSVEVITSPSAKYDAEGSGGIINIVTKKNTIVGATLSIDAGVGLRGSNLGLSGNYRTKKMGFSLGGFGRSSYNVTGSFENSQLTNDGTTETLNLQNSDNLGERLFGNYKLGWDYDIDQKNSLAASVRFGARNGKNYQDDFFTQSYTNGVLNSSSLRDVSTADLSNNVDINLTYTHLYDKPQREFSLLALYSKNNRNNDFESRTREEDGVATLNGYKNLNDSYDREMTIQADYQTPIGTNQMVEFGGKDIMRTAVSDYTYFTDDDGDGVYVPSTNSRLSNNLNYDQNVIAGYLSYTLSLQGGYSIKAGTRYEYTTINAYTQTEDNIEIPSYGVMVPSVNVSKKLKTGTLKAAYNRRIQRPSIRFLNPNIQASNPIDISSGNPELDPEYTNNYEVSYSTYIKGTSLNFSSFIRNTTGAIQRVRKTTDVEGQVLTTYENIGTENAYGASIFANVNIGNLTLNGGTDLYYQVLDNGVDAHSEGWTMGGRAFGSYKLGKGWGLQLFSFYRGNSVQLQGTRGGFGMYSLSIKKDINEKKGSIGFGAENFFTPSNTVRSTLITPEIQQESIMVMNRLSFRINFSYRIGKMSVDARPRRRKTINNDDLMRGGDGGGMDMDAGGGGEGGAQQPAQQRGGRTAPATNPAPKKTTDIPVSDPAAEVVAEGTWKYTVESPRGGGGTLNIKKDGESYSGTIINDRSNTEVPLSEVIVQGNGLSFQYETQGQGGNPMVVKVKSVITGDALNGDISIGQFGVFPIKATRER